MARLREGISSIVLFTVTSVSGQQSVFTKWVSLWFMKTPTVHCQRSSDSRIKLDNFRHMIHAMSPAVRELYFEGRGQIQYLYPSSTIVLGICGLAAHCASPVSWPFIPRRYLELEMNIWGLYGEMLRCWWSYIWGRERIDSLALEAFLPGLLACFHGPTFPGREIHSALPGILANDCKKLLLLQNKLGLKSPCVCWVYLHIFMYMCVHVFKVMYTWKKPQNEPGTLL